MIREYCDICGIESVRYLNPFKFYLNGSRLYRYFIGVEYNNYWDLAICSNCAKELHTTISNKITEMRKYKQPNLEDRK